MEKLFHETIENWDDWGRVFRSVPAFEALASEILRREGFPRRALRLMTPGTSAVFRSGNVAVKIFFPRESGLDPLPDFQNELTVCGRLSEQGVAAPRVLASGVMEDKYDFPYILAQFVPGREAGDYLRDASLTEKQAFVRRLKEMLCKLNQEAEGLLPPVDLLSRALKSPRREKLPESLRQDMEERARSLDLSQRVLVHGDLTGENLLVGEDGSLTVLDCADACLAPAWYELAPVVFELFRCDPALLREFAGSHRDAFVELTLDAVSVHDFGPDLLAETAGRDGRPVFRRLHNVREYLLERF